MWPLGLASTGRCSGFESRYRRCRPMRENEFPDRLRDALGEPPQLVQPRLGPPDAVAPRAYPRAMAPIAVVLAILLLAVLVASRIALRPQPTHVPVVHARASPVPADSFT